MVDAKPTISPKSSSKLDNFFSDLLSDSSTYHSMVRALQYLTWTRPDIAHAVNQVCQHIHSPRTQHLVAAMHIFRYLKGTPDNGLSFSKGPNLLTTFSDADPPRRLNTVPWHSFVAKVLWLCFLFQDLHLYLSHCPLFYCDNIYAIALVVNPVLHSHTKHVDVDFHFIREPVTNRSIRLQYVSSAANVADIFTKGLPNHLFSHLCSKLIDRSLTFNLQGA